MREGWVETTLGDISTTAKGATIPPPNMQYVGMEHVDPGARTVVRSATTSTIESISAPFKKGDILYGKLRPYLRKVSLAENDGWCSNEILVFRAKDGSIIHNYLFHLLRSDLVADFAIQNSTGSRMPRISPKMLNNLSVRLPPLQEQRRIVDLMDAVDAAVDAAQAEVETATKSRRTVFDGLISAKGVELEWKPLGKTGTFRRGRRFTKADYVESGLPCIHYGQIHTDLGLRTYSSLTYLPESMSDKLRLAQPDDLVFTATSEDIDDLGKVTVWLGGRPAAVHDDCQIFQHGMDPVFAVYLADSFEFHRQKVGFAAGTKVTRISGNDLAKIVLPIPDRGTQRKIGQIMGFYDDAITAATAALDRLRDLRSSLLTCLLSGQHEIPESYDRFL